MTYQEMNEAIREAELTVRRAETYLNQMARFPPQSEKGA